MILLAVLKITGLILAGMLSLLILLFLLVIACPVQYQIQAEKSGDLYGKGRIQWLFGLAAFDISYREGYPEFSFRIAVFRKKLGGSSGESKKNKARENQTEKKHKARKKHTGKGSFETITDILRKILRSVFRQEKRAAAMQILRRLQRVFRHMIPRKVTGRVCFGTGAPDTTAFLYAAAQCGADHIGADLLIVPDLEHRILEFSVQLKGHFSIGYLAAVLVKLVKDQNCKNIMKDIRSS